MPDWAPLAAWVGTWRPSCHPAHRVPQLGGNGDTFSITIPHQPGCTPQANTPLSKNREPPSLHPPFASQKEKRNATSHLKTPRQRGHGPCRGLRGCRWMKQAGASVTPPCSVPGQTPCKESCCAMQDTLPTLRTVPPTQHTPAPQYPRDPQPQNPLYLCSATTLPCPGPSLSPPRANPGPAAPAEAGALITPPVGSAATPLPTQCLRMHLSTDTFCCRQRFFSGGGKPPFPPKRHNPEWG